MRISDEVTKNIIKKLLKGEDYRIEVVSLLNSIFFDYVKNFLLLIPERKAALIKLSDEESIDFEKLFLNKDLKLSSKEIMINSGMNKKTIKNMYNTAVEKVVKDASKKNFSSLKEILSKLSEDEEMNLNLSIEFNKGKVKQDFDFKDFLFIVNALAVKRAELRGGLWSTAGKRVEKPLMITLCKIFGVDENNYHKGNLIDEGKNYSRETDFYLINGNKKFKCEVKLMGKGNPESADAFYARDSHVFVADKLSDTNIKQLDDNSVQWVQLRSKEGFKRFEKVLKKLKIKYSGYNKNYEKNLDKFFEKIFD